MKHVDRQHAAMIDEEIYFHQLENQLPARTVVMDKQLPNIRPNTFNRTHLAKHIHRNTFTRSLCSTYEFMSGSVCTSIEPP